MFYLFCLKELTTIIKAARFGILAIIGYGIFIMYVFIKNIATGDIPFSAKWDTLPMFKFDLKDLSGIAGNFALAYYI